MEINMIILELLNRIQVLETKVATLEQRMVTPDSGIATATKPPFPANKISKKYLRLGECLYENWDRKITLTYEEIERILNFTLPDTAYNFPQSFWANTKTHTYSSSWLALGYKATVNFETKTVTFERSIF